MSESVLISVEDEAKQVKKLSQLADARESAKLKRKQRDDDLSAVNNKLEKLTALMEAKPAAKADLADTAEIVFPEEVPVKKRKVIVTRHESEEEPAPTEASPTWLQSVFRTTAVLALGAGSYYFQNIYGKQKAIASSKTTAKVQAKPTVVPVWSEIKGKSKVGESGFVL